MNLNKLIICLGSYSELVKKHALILQDFKDDLNISQRLEIMRVIKELREAEELLFNLIPEKEKID